MTDGSKNRVILQRLFDVGVTAASAQQTLPPALPKGAPRGRTIVLGAGKASAEMARVAVECLPGEVIGCVVTRYGHRPQSAGQVELLEAGHPTPDENSLRAAARIRGIAEAAAPDDRVLFLISGGGSSVLCEPIDGITLEEKTAIGAHLVRSGLPIDEINLVRRHLSRVKGGRLGAAAAAAECYTFVVSDVVGDDAATVASGPSVPSPFEPDRALETLKRAGWAPSPSLVAAMRRQVPVSAPHPVAIVATNRHALDAIRIAARDAGWNVVSRGSSLTGEAARVGRDHAAWAMDFVDQPGNHLLLSGGELTVSVGNAEGSGGPNLEYLAGLMEALPTDAPVEAMACDSDGIDGTETNAGGYFMAEWKGRLQAVGFDLERALSSHTTYPLFEALGGLVTTGPTLTNVNDIRMIAVEGSR